MRWGGGEDYHAHGSTSEFIAVPKVVVSGRYYHGCALCSSVTVSRAAAIRVSSKQYKKNSKYCNLSSAFDC